MDTKTPLNTASADHGTFAHTPAKASWCGEQLLAPRTALILLSCWCVLSAFYVILAVVTGLTWQQNTRVQAGADLLIFTILVAALMSCVVVAALQVSKASSADEEEGKEEEAVRPAYLTLCGHGCCFCIIIAALAGVTIFIVLWIQRALGFENMDDVHPLMPCPYLDTFVHSRRGNYLWVIPAWAVTPGNFSYISDFPTWCAKLRGWHESGQVVLGMHAFHHGSESEFVGINISTAKAMINAGIDEFGKCFNMYPRFFSPPGADMSPDLVSLFEKAYGMRVRTAVDGLTNRIYHCDDSFCPNPIMCTTAALSVF